MNQGISRLQGAHHVAQKFSRTTLPRNSESLTVLPEASSKANSGAILRCSDFTYTVLGAELDMLPTNRSRTQLAWPTHAETQRCANTRVVGNAISGRPAATTPVASHTHLRLRLLMLSRCFRNSANPRNVSGCQSLAGRSAARRSSTH